MFGRRKRAREQEQGEAVAVRTFGDGPMGTASLVGLAHARTRLNELRQLGAGS